MEWRNVTTNSNLILHNTGRAVLIKLPGSKFKFWHPTKCIRTSGKGGYRLQISYTDEFKFNIFRTGEGKYNSREKIEEQTISVPEFEKYFGQEEEETDEGED